MTGDVLLRVEGIADELRRVRESIHRCPEVGNQEFRTAEKIEAFLHDCGIKTTRLTETGVLAELRGELPGKTVCFRADMDALPLTEKTGAAFASENDGIMHACGHDVHMAALLGAAKLLSLEKDTLHGTVRFIFQPDEEQDGGAERMVQGGCMEGADAVFGAHVVPDIPLGRIGIRYGKFYAAADKPDFVIHGQSCHGATPALGIDALHAAAMLACKLKQLPELYPDDCFACSIGTLHAGEVRNIIAGEARMSGILRTLGPDTRRRIKAAILTAVKETEIATGVTIDTVITEGYPGVVNEDAMTALAEKTAIALFGPENVVRIDQPCMTTEDFGAYLDKAPGSYYHLGAGCSLPLHNTAFLPDERSVLYGAAMHTALAEAFLNGD